MLQKNQQKLKRKKHENTWVGYFPRVTKDKTKYTRKLKHKNKHSCI